MDKQSNIATIDENISIVIYKVEDIKKKIIKEIKANYLIVLQNKILQCFWSFKK